MICYEFEERFIAPLLAGTKRVTLRKGDAASAPRKGERVALISGDKVVGIATVFDARLVGLTIRDDGAAVPTRDGMIEEEEDLFARLDGFEDEWAMGAWYDAHYKIGRGRAMAFQAIEFGLEERRMPW
jgi:hypothetical protein